MGPRAARRVCLHYPISRRGAGIPPGGARGRRLPRHPRSSAPSRLLPGHPQVRSGPRAQSWSPSGRGTRGDTRVRGCERGYTAARLAEPRLSPNSRLGPAGARALRGSTGLPAPGQSCRGLSASAGRVVARSPQSPRTRLRPSQRASGPPGGWRGPRAGRPQPQPRAPAAAHLFSTLRILWRTPAREEADRLPPPPLPSAGRFSMVVTTWFGGAGGGGCSCCCCGSGGIIAAEAAARRRSERCWAHRAPAPGPGTRGGLCRAAAARGGGAACQAARRGGTRGYGRRRRRPARHSHLSSPSVRTLAPPPPPPAPALPEPRPQVPARPAKWP